MKNLTKESFDQSSLKPKKFDITMQEDELHNLKNAVLNGDTDKFIEEYINAHQADRISSVEDVYSLALIEAILKKEHFLVLALLPHVRDKLHILVDINGNNQNVMCAALATGDNSILTEISMYLKKYVGIKFIMSDEILPKISKIVASPESEYYNPKSYIEKFLTLIYIPESIEELIKIVGQEHIDYYYQ